MNNNLKVGDLVRITKSEKDWTDRMDQYDGLVVRIGRIFDHNIGMVEFDNSEHPEINRWVWKQSNGHFVVMKKNKEESSFLPPPTFSQSFLSFLHDIKYESRIARIILACLDLVYNQVSHVVRLALTTKEINYITFRKDGTISYWPSSKGGEQPLTEDGTWSLKGRQNGKPAKVIRKLFTPKLLKLLKDSDFELFNNKYLSKFSVKQVRIEVLPSSEIGRIYDHDRAEGGGTLNDSCMRGCGSYYRMLEDAKDKVSIVVAFTEDNRVAGRALLWQAKDSDNTIEVLDRIYVAEDHLYETFLEFAKQQGYWTKKYYKTRDSKRIFVDPSTKEEKIKVFRVNLDTEDYIEYPYLDTFAFGGDGYLTNDEGDHPYQYTETDGTRESDKTWDNIDECHINNDDAVTIDGGQREGEVTHINNTVIVNNSYYYNDDEGICYSSYDDRYYLLDNCSFSEHHDSYILTEEAYEIEGVGIYHQDIVSKL